MFDQILASHDDSKAQHFFKTVSTFHCVAVFSLEGVLLEANDSFLNTLGYSIDEVQGQTHRIFLPDPETKDAGYATMWSDFADGKARTGEVLRRTKCGKICWLQAVYCPMSNEDGEVCSVLKLAVPTSLELIDNGINSPLKILEPKALKS